MNWKNKKTRTLKKVPKIDRTATPSPSFGRPKFLKPMVKIPNPKYRPTSIRQDEYTKLSYSIVQSIALMESVCGFLKSNVLKLTDGHPCTSSSTRTPTHLGKVAKKSGKSKVAKSTRKSVRVSTLKDIPPGFSRSDALLVPFDESRNPSFTTCEVPEVSDPEKGTRCFDYYRGDLPGSLDDEVSEYFIKNGKKLGRRPENRGKEFKKMTIDSTTDDQQTPDSTTQPME